jgi:hypothetical protein
MRSLVVGLMTLSLTTCGGNAGFPTLTGPPGKPPSAHGVDSGPPPAWVQTARGARWLGYSSFCWGELCADYAGARCGDALTPTLQLTRAEVVQFHLAFAPSELAILRGRRTRPERLRPVRSPRWRARAAGALTLFVRAKKGGDASYTACLRFDQTVASVVPMHERVTTSSADEPAVDGKRSDPGDREREG